MKKLIAVVVAGAVAVLIPQGAQAYDFTVQSNFTGGLAFDLRTGTWTQVSGDVVYAHLETVSAFCHDRSPVVVKDGDPPLKAGGSVSGSTAPGCLVGHVAMIVADGRIFSWTAPTIGDPGGTWSLCHPAMEPDWTVVKGSSMSDYCLSASGPGSN